MPLPGDVVVARFVGAVQTKSRPVVVVSSDLYHRSRPDCIIGVLTSRVQTATAPTDYLLQDWSPAGLHQPSAFRAYFNMALQRDLDVIGHLSPRDWHGVRERLALALALFD